MMARNDGRYSEYIVIETNRPFYAWIDMYKDPGMAKLKEAELAETLPESRNPTVQSRAILFQKPNMLMEEYKNEEGDTKRRFKESVMLAEADERGRIFLEKTEVELARRILKTLRKVDKTVGIDPSSALTEEEILGPRTENKGGRGRKTAK